MGKRKSPHPKGFERIALVDAGMREDGPRLLGNGGFKRRTKSRVTAWRDAKVDAALAALPRPLKPPGRQ